jgi:hypothetical protein
MWFIFTCKNNDSFTRHISKYGRTGLIHHYIVRDELKNYKERVPT